MPLIKELSRDLGLPVVERPGVEADDVIASTALSAARKGFRVVILTADKDILQVLDENLQVMRPVKGVSEFRLWTSKASGKTTASPRGNGRLPGHGGRQRR
jgi:DNA polymerase-1